MDMYYIYAYIYIYICKYIYIYVYTVILIIVHSICNGSNCIKLIDEKSFIL